MRFADVRLKSKNDYIRSGSETLGLPGAVVLSIGSFVRQETEQIPDR